MKHIVCLGGGIGTVNLVAGLKKYTHSIAVVVSMADEGGSSGRLRRLYRLPPPGDLVSCMAALSNIDTISKMLTYRFPGDRYGNDKSLAGHKLGNLMMAALSHVTGSFDQAAKQLQEILKIKGTLLLATERLVSISAETVEGKKVRGEEAIDLGKYDGQRVLKKVFLHPKNAKAGAHVVESILKADVVIAGPGDLYTTLLPVLLVNEIAESLVATKAQKIFIVNVANKPFETKGYSVGDYCKAIKNHLGSFPFDKIVVNNNVGIKMPKGYHYQYVPYEKEYPLPSSVIYGDLVDNTFPLYHSSEKLAKVIMESI